MPRPKAPEFDYTPTTLPADHLLVHLGPPQGSNNFSSVDVSGKSRLVELSSRLRTRGATLVARGDFAFIRLFPLDPKGGEERLLGEIVKVLSGKEVRDFKRSGEWPEGFGDAPPEPQAPASGGQEEGSSEEGESESGSEEEEEEDVNVERDALGNIKTSA